MLRIHFVLNRPAIAENIGASARAIATMGFESLRLVSPCDHLQDQAKWMACGAVEILEQAQVFDNLGDALRDVDFVIGATARIRRRRHEYYTPKGILNLVRARGETLSKVAVVFGPESSGLSNEDLTFCDVLSSVPSAEEHPVLNLAQTVMIYAYELSALSVAVSERGDIEREIKSSHAVLREKLEALFLHLEIDSENPGYGRIIERLSALDEEGIRLVHFLRKKIEEKIAGSRSDH